MNLFQWRCLYHKWSFDLIKFGFHQIGSDYDFNKENVPYWSYDKVSQLKCKNCPYYTGIQCHGHGDYWGECSLINLARTILSKINGVDSWKLHFNDLDCLMSEIRFDESECLIFKVVK